MTGHVTAPAAALADQLPSWVTLLRAANPGPMTLDGTNTWVLRGADRVGGVVIDPGPADEPHLAAIAERAPIATILITHGHADHVEGAGRLSELLGGVPVLAADPAHCLGADPSGLDRDPGAPGLGIRAVRTPGHTADSVCFEVELGGERAVFTGDTILGRGTTVVAWPDGDLADYLASLARLSAYEGVPALPGHGPALADCAAAARVYLAHRRARLDQVRRAVAEGAGTAEEVVATVYADVDRSLWPAAERSVRAQLAYLRREIRESGPGAARLELP